MIKHEIVAVSAAASVTGLLSNATGATWTLTANDSGDTVTVNNGTTVAMAHLVTIKGDAATDHSAKTAEITGTGPEGEAQTETVNLPNGTATVTSTKYFRSVTTVVPSATIGADTMDIGWAAGSVSPAFNPQLARVSNFNLGFGCNVAAGSPTYTVQHSYDNGASWFNHATVAAETTSQEGTYTSPVQAVRLMFAAAGSVTLTGYQVEG